MNSGIKQKTINDFVKKELARAKKPWWKFW